MPIELGGSHLAGFDDPIAMMVDCHRRIEHFLALLQRVAERQGATLDDEHRAALERALEYFRVAAPRHTADEEESLFPLMRGTDSGTVAESMATIDSLESDHQQASRLHARVDELGLRWLADGTLPAGEAEEFTRALETLAATYATHIAIEDGKIFPLARGVLDDDQVRQVGREMAARRGQRYPH